MISRTLAALALVASSVAIDIRGPSADAYWVQNVSNVINWSFSNDDPNPIDIVIKNGNSSLLNGAFAIERNVDLTNGTFTVSNVSLKSGPGYTVAFVNGSNPEQVYATSREFDVRVPGTPVSDSEDARPPGASSTSGSGTQTSTGANPTATSPTGTGATAPSATPSNAALNQVVPVLGIAMLSGLAALL